MKKILLIAPLLLCLSSCSNEVTLTVVAVRQVIVNERIVQVGNSEYVFGDMSEFEEFKDVEYKYTLTFEKGYIFTSDDEDDLRRYLWKNTPYECRIRGYGDGYFMFEGFYYDLGKTECFLNDTELTNDVVLYYSLIQT